MHLSLVMTFSQNKGKAIVRPRVVHVYPTNLAIVNPVISYSEPIILTIFFLINFFEKASKMITAITPIKVFVSTCTPHREYEHPDTKVNVSFKMLNLIQDPNKNPYSVPNNPEVSAKVVFKGYGWMSTNPTQTKVTARNTNRPLSLNKIHCTIISPYFKKKLNVQRPKIMPPYTSTGLCTHK